MKRTVDERILVIADACVLINFILVGRLDLLSRHKDFQILITEHVRAEVTDSYQATTLVSAISAGEIVEIAVTDPAELALFATLNTVLGKGESAAIAVAAQRGAWQA